VAKNTHNIRFFSESNKHNFGLFLLRCKPGSAWLSQNLILSRENRTLLVEFSWGGIFFIRMPSCLIGMLVYNAFLKFLFGRNLASPVIDLVFLIVVIC
jgi:hypothetical protein